MAILEIKMGSSRDTTDQSQNKDLIYPLKHRKSIYIYFCQAQQ
jgi:hypothetical protein